MLVQYRIFVELIQVKRRKDILIENLRYVLFVNHSLPSRKKTAGQALLRRRGLVSFCGLCKKLCFFAVKCILNFKF